MRYKKNSFVQDLAGFGTLMSVSGFYLSTYLNIVILFSIILAQRFHVFNSNRILFFIFGLSLLLWKLITEVAIFFDSTAQSFFWGSIVYYAAFSYIFLVSGFSFERLVTFISKYGWTIIFLNFYAFFLDITGSSSIFFPRNDAVIDVSGISSGLNESAIGLAIVGGLSAIKFDKSRQYFHLLQIFLSFFGLVILGATLPMILLTFITIYFNPIRGFILISFLVFFGTVAMSYLELGSEAFSVIRSFDHYLIKIFSDIRYTLLILSVETSLDSLSSVFFGYSKFHYNDISGGNSHHTLVGEFFSFGFFLGVICSLILTLGCLYSASILILSRNKATIYISVFYLLVFGLSFASSSSLRSVIYSLLVYSLWLVWSKACKNSPSWLSRFRTLPFA